MSITEGPTHICQCGVAFHMPENLRVHRTACQIPKLMDERDTLKLQNEDLHKKLTEYRRMLWVLSRKEGLSLRIPKAELDAVPEGAEILSWYEPLFDVWMLKGIGSPINQPGLATPVTEKPLCARWTGGEGGDFQCELDKNHDGACGKKQTSETSRKRYDVDPPYWMRSGRHG